MVTVKIKKGMYLTEHGSVKKGDVVEISETAARTLFEKGFVEEANEADAKAAQEHKNKMAAPTKNKGTEDIHDMEHVAPQPAKTPMSPTSTSRRK